MNRSHFDAPDTDVHFGGIAVGGMPNRARCSCGACGRRRRKRGRRDKARCSRNQGRKCGHTSRLDKLCRPKTCGLSHRGRCGILIRNFAHRVRRAQRRPVCRVQRRSHGRDSRSGKWRGGFIACRLREYRGHVGIVSAWKREGRHRMGLFRFGERRLVCRVRRGHGGDPRSRKRRGGFIACRLLEYHGHGGIREPGGGFHRHAEPERLSRKAAQITTHAITMPR